MLADGADRVKVAVLPQHHLLQHGHGAIRVSPVMEMARDHRSGLVDLLLLVEQLGTLGDQRLGVLHFGMARGGVPPVR